MFLVDDRHRQLSPFIRTDLPFVLTSDKSSSPILQHKRTVSYGLFKDLFALQVETFRKSRFTSHFTHLKFDCTRGWPYGSLLPVVVALALLALCVGVAVAFLARFQICMRN